MIVINRFRCAPGQDFAALAAPAVELLRGKPGNLDVDLVRNLDDEQLWALVSRWEHVGAYRRALGGYESKTVVVPLLSMAVDEPSAYDVPGDVGRNLPRGAEPPTSMDGID